MRLNQVTLPAIDVTASVAFYQCVGFELIVDAPHYARFKSMEGDTTFSVHKVDLLVGASQTVVYFETSSLDETVKRLQAKGWSSGKRHATNRGSGARHDLRIFPATSSVSTGPVLVVSTRHGEFPVGRSRDRRNGPTGYLPGTWRTG